ncbi:MAG: hypothetical protein ACI392_07970 [Paludibacteraceae bacterium]
MNKDTLIVLIEKDIAELQALTQGLAQMTTFPQPLIDLAVAKVESLRRCLTALPEVTCDSDSTTPTVATNDTPVVTELEPKPEVDANLESVSVSAPEPEPESELESESESEVESEPTVDIVECVDNQTNVTDSADEEPAAHIVADTIRKPETVVDVFEKQQDTASLAATIANRPVTDIKRAISIADRFRFQRELFGNNGEQMATVLDALNDCTSLEQAEAYLEKHCALPADNAATADFVDLIKRRFA